MLKRMLVILMLGVVGVVGCEQRAPVQSKVDFGIADQVESVRGCVVHVLSNGHIQGSGSVISPEGIICTAKHVTEGTGGDYVVTFDDGRKYSVKNILESEDYDVSFLLLDTTDTFDCLKLSDFNKMRVGEGLFIIGSPYGFVNFNSVTLGILSAKQRDLDEDNQAYVKYGWHVTFQSDAPAHPGNSGGPVFNMQGEMIGVLVAGMSPVINYSVPTTTFMNDIENIKLALQLMKFRAVDMNNKPVYQPDEYYRK